MIFTGNVIYLEGEFTYQWTLYHTQPASKMLLFVHFKATASNYLLIIPSSIYLVVN